LFSSWNLLVLMTGLEIGIQMSSAGLPVAALDNFTPWAPGESLSALRSLTAFNREDRKGLPRRSLRSTSAFRVLEQGGREFRVEAGGARAGRAGRMRKKSLWMRGELGEWVVLIL